MTIDARTKRLRREKAAMKSLTDDLEDDLERALEHALDSPDSDEAASLLWIDLDHVRDSIKGCDTHHGEHCHLGAAATTTLQRPHWLIDVSRACLVRPPPSAPYVALSYVWGQAVTGVALRDHLDQLQEPGALLEPTVPRTVRDVIHVLRLLGEHFLWVDRLCIVQDDHENKQAQINNMASIYSGASLTLVAAVGDDADDGLRGLENITPPMEKGARRGIRWDFVTEHQITRIPPITSTAWYTRGWTLQEAIFSRRMLCFTEVGAFWECHCYTRSEYQHRGSLNEYHQQCTEKLPDIFRSSFFPSWPNLNMYLQLVATYNARSLSTDGDVLAAFSGITTSLRDSFAGGFLYGLPEVFLDVALLWRPLGHCRRRTPPGNEHRPPLRLPSWSWVGWQAEIDPQSWKCGYDYIKSTNVVSWPGSRYNVSLRSKSSWRIKPAVKWFVADGVDSPVRPAIEGYQRYERNGEVPKGWSRYSLPFEGPDEVEFAHESIPRTRFRFPIPLAPKGAGNPGFDDSRSPYLCCKTTRVSLLLQPVNKKHRSLSLYTADGTWAGVVRMHLEVPAHAVYVGAGWVETVAGVDSETIEDAEISELWDGPDPFSPDQSTMRWGDFVMISEGTARNSWNEEGFLEEWSHSRRPRNGMLYEFVNVLCIATRDGISYRKGVGRVVKSVWLGQGPEAIDLTLG